MSDFEGRPLSCIPSPWDPRDYKYTSLLAATGAQAAPPATIDYRPNLPSAFDQGARGSCVACAGVWTTKAYQEMSQGACPVGGLSAAYLYSQCKQIDDYPGKEGTTVKAAMQVLQKYGVCPEVDMPYNRLASLPVPKVPAISQTATNAAEKYKIKTYAQMCSPTDKDRSGLLTAVRQALLREGPIVLALLVCSNFEPDASGRLPLPEGMILGGHAVGIVGDLPDIGCLILRNSWGRDWGVDGYAYLPYEWLTRTSDTFKYVFEAWTSTDIVVPKPATRIEIKPGEASMIVDGQSVVLDQPAEITDLNRTLMPVRAMAGNMGYLVQWVDGKVILTKPN